MEDARLDSTEGKLLFARQRRLRAARVRGLAPPSMGGVYEEREKRATMHIARALGLLPAEAGVPWALASGRAVTKYELEALGTHLIARPTERAAAVRTTTSLLKSACEGADPGKSPGWRF